MTADQETASKLPELATETRYVMLVVTSRNRSDQRLDIVEFRSKAAVKKAMEHLGLYQQFDVCVVDDSVPS
jgi:hypothetical protein